MARIHWLSIEEGAALDILALSGRSVFAVCPCVFARADSVAELSDSFWQWRAQEQPFSDDDIPRIERPAGLVVDWSPQTITQRLQQLDGFEQRWKALAPSAQTPIHDQVDYRLLGSAVARVRWELSIEQSWKRNPQFYVDQTLGSVFILLLPPPPFSESRQQEIVAALSRSRPRFRRPRKT